MPHLSPKISFKLEMNEVSKSIEIEASSREKISTQLFEIVREMQEGEKKFSTLLDELHPNFKESGRNLIHYLILRSKEIRDMQEYLHHKGLSSLTNSESHTLSQLLYVLSWLDPSKGGISETSCSFRTASKLKLSHAVQLLGSFPAQDRPHIMVTLSAPMMYDKNLLEKMLEEGMSIVRINCAHDKPKDWANMIANIKKAKAKTGKDCKVYMDLGGPKFRIYCIGAKKKKYRSRLPVEVGTELVLEYASQKNALSLAKKVRGKPILFVKPKEILKYVKPGEHIYFDDGKFKAKVTAASPNRIKAEIVRISTHKPYLKPEKGINLPDSNLNISPLTRTDKKNIPFICKHADMIGYSFVNGVEDVELLRNEIQKYVTTRAPSIILKIERLAAVQSLPALLINGMKDESMGVMIARGDLAVEIGFERLSEIQEEILWICEAAHVPVIWATQVLETLNKTGYATRSEITDAAMSGRAECVMLNKGDYILKTIKMLDNILTRQLGHINKKRYIMRPLNIARNFLEK